MFLVKFFPLFGILSGSAGPVKAEDVVPEKKRIIIAITVHTSRHAGVSLFLKCFKLIVRRTGFLL